MMFKPLFSSRAVLTLLFPLAIVLSPTLAAKEFGDIQQYHENIQPSGSEGIINTSVTATTNAEGVVYLPAYEKGELANYEVLSGTLIGMPERVDIHGREAYRYRFASSDNLVTLQQTFQVKKLYKEKKAKLKYSHPAGVTRVSYTFTNTSPSTIDDFSTQLSVPKGTELYGVVTPEWSKKKKTFTISKLDDWKVVTVNRSALTAGQDVETKVRLYRPAPNIKWVLWTFVILISGALLWKRRDVLVDEKEAVESAPIEEQK